MSRGPRPVDSAGPPSPEQFAIPFVKAVVITADRLLLQRRVKAGDLYRGFWELPGGKMRLGETAEAALRRELFEETGLRLVELLGQPEEHLTDDFGRSARVLHPLVTVEIVSGPLPFLGHYFACRAEGDPYASAEGGEHRLVTPAEFREEFLLPESGGRCTTLDLLAMRIILREDRLAPFLEASS
jgi:8-oxo-dGTP pyrophosphatase MutT (NUDIX family)